MMKESLENPGILLGLLQSVERDGAQSQRRMAAELGVALGLVNTYLKRCMRKGLVKVSHAPARRYAYYLTPQGFAEKVRLTSEYLSHSMNFFRRARLDCAEVFAAARARGWTRLALVGVSDLAEIALLCAAEAGVTVVGVVDPSGHERTFHGIGVTTGMAGLHTEVDAVVVTMLVSPMETYEALVSVFGADRVLVPAVLGLRPPGGGGSR